MKLLVILAAVALAILLGGVIRRRQALSGEGRPRRRVSLLLFVPPLVFAAIAAGFYLGMRREDPEALPSAIEGKLAPRVTLAALGDRAIWDDATLAAPGVKLVNYWASWCAPCRTEHPNLEALAAEGIPIYGINYKDEPARAEAFLDELGDPYIAVGTDESGRTAIDWGLYGVPETYVIDGAGRVVLRFAGPITERSLAAQISACDRKGGGMTVTLKGSCRCGAVRFTVASHAPQPYQLCYCAICRKTAGGGGYAINLSAIADTLKVEGREAIGIYRAEIDRDGHCETSSGERNFCTRCATALWLWDPEWPELVHPFASAIDSDLPVPPSRVHLMLDFKPSWVVPRIGADDLTFARYPEQSIEDWHRQRGLWID